VLTKFCGLDETDIIQGCLKKKLAAQHALFEKYAGILMTICRRYAGDQHEAEDMLQEAFINIFNHIGQFKFNGSFDGWLKRITVHAAIRLLQRRKITIIALSKDQYDVISPDSDGSADMDAEDLLKVIRELPDGYRLVFNLYAIEGYSHDEIAKLLNIKTATSRSQLSKARSMLKDKITLMKKIRG